MHNLTLNNAQSFGKFFSSSFLECCFYFHGESCNKSKQTQRFRFKYVIEYTHKSWCKVPRGDHRSSSRTFIMQITYFMVFWAH